MSPCYCTGACRTIGICPNARPGYVPAAYCNHVFPWYGVVPPLYCNICGAYIGPVYCPPAPQPWPNPLPYITYTVNSDSTTKQPTPEGVTLCMN
jgi:hypothetical protein